MQHRAISLGLLLVLACLLSPGPCRSATSGRTYHILVINSRQQGTPWTFAMMGSLQETLLNVHLDTELQIDYMHTARFIPGRTYFKKRTAVYAYEFKRYKFDCIISVGEDALSFMREFGLQIFPNAPVIFCGLSSASAKRAQSLPRAAAVSSDWNLKRSVGMITNVCPWAKKIVFVHDQTSEGRAIGEDARAIEPGFPHLRFKFLTDVTMQQLVSKVKRLPDDAVLVLLPFTIDKAGNYYAPDQAVRMLAHASNVPSFGLWSFEMNDGLTGGLLLDEHEYGRGVAKAALRIATGENPKTVKLPHRIGTQGVFDYRKVRQFGISLADLPPGSTLIHRPSSMLADHRRTLVWMGATVAALLAIFGLWAISANRRRRAIENRLRLEHETNEHKRRFYRETLLSATDDKLEVCDYPELEPYLNSAEVRVNISKAEDIPAARVAVREYCTQQGMDEERLSSFLMGVGEAANNAMKHAAGGQVLAGRSNGQVWTAIVDHGSGIDSLILPRVALQRGFSTKPSLGMGYTVMLDVADRVLLATGEQGTTVVLFKSIQEPQKPPLFDLGGSLSDG